MGNRKLSVQFSNFPAALWTVAALISLPVLETAKFQVLRGEFSITSKTSSSAGWVETCALGALN